jgi:hypothetical protein
MYKDSGIGIDGFCQKRAFKNSLFNRDLDDNEATIDPVSVWLYGSLNRTLNRQEY